MHSGNWVRRQNLLIGYSEGSQVSRYRRVLKQSHSIKARASPRIGYAGMRSCFRRLTDCAHRCLNVAPGSGHTAAPNCNHSCMQTNPHRILSCTVNSCLTPRWSVFRRKVPFFGVAVHIMLCIDVDAASLWLKKKSISPFQTILSSIDCPHDACTSLG